MPQEHNELEPGWIFRILTTCLLLGLLLEWLFPWLNAGEWRLLFHPHYLIWMTAIMLGIGLIRLPLHWFICSGLIVWVVSLFLLYRVEGQHIGEWLVHFMPSLTNNLSDMLKYGIAFMSDEFRTLLLFTGWLLLAPALQSVIWQYHFSLALMGATIAYLLTLHTFLGIDIWLGLLRVIGAGLLLTALTTGQKLRRYMPESQQDSKALQYRWVSATALIAIVLAGSFFISENKNKQGEPIAWAEIFSKSMAEELAAWSQQSSGIPLKNVTSSNFRGQSAAIAGYDSDDSQLGAKLSTNTREIVFYGWSSHMSYWRGETRSTYTGKGWIDQGEALTLHKTAEDAETALAELSARTRGERIQQTVTFQEPVIGLPLFQGGMKGVVLQLEAGNPDRQLSNYIVEPATGALYPPTTDAAVKSYTLITELPYNEKILQTELDEPTEQQAQRIWEEDMLSEYLQLPESLPERVAALAAEVAGGGITSRYDQVKAIEQYLQSNYSYSRNSRLPGGNEDFVDHFLFEQQQGYCVHFSTAMVVMLRSLDIPARYVKGYQSGEAIDQRMSESGILESLYQVSQNDAHAWVEVYFPEAGWVPFDPTPSASESVSLDTSWLAPYTKLGDQWLGKLQAWSNLLTTSQWTWLAALLSVILVGWLALLLSWNRLQCRLRLRSYKQAYEQLLQEGVQLEGNSQQESSSVTERNGEALHSSGVGLPARSRQRLAQYQLAQERKRKLQQQLVSSLEELILDLFKLWERKAGIQDNTLFWQTWRQRWGALVQLRSDYAKYEQQLMPILAALEQLKYSNYQTALEPQKLQSYLRILRGSSVKNAEKQPAAQRWLNEHEELKQQKEHF